MSAAVASADVVTSFIQALERRDLDAALALVTDDVEYDNVPMSKVHGPDGIRQVLEPFLGMCTAVEWVVHHQAATGDVVMNERTDRFELNGRWIAVSVAGLFVLRDGKIALWRDYFDQGQFNQSMAG
jgi:limonene-1,2-epoxide hydrolase